MIHREKVCCYGDITKPVVRCMRTGLMVEQEFCFKRCKNLQLVGRDRRDIFSHRRLRIEQVNYYGSKNRRKLVDRRSVTDRRDPERKSSKEGEKLL